MVPSNKKQEVRNQFKFCFGVSTMILYHIDTTYQLLHCIFYKELFHKEQICYLLLSNLLLEKYPQLKQMEGVFFNKIFVFKDIENNSIRSIDGGVGKNVLEENNINPQEFSEIIVGNSNSFTENYLMNNRCNFTYFEGSNGLMNRKDILESMRKVDPHIVDQVLLLWGINQKIQIYENSTILLTEPCSTHIPFEELKKIYKIMVDYFIGENELVIIPHPDDLLFYEYLFPHATIIKKKFPPEFIPFIFTKKPKTVMSLSSNSMIDLAGYSENHIKVSSNFESYLNSTHKYFCAMKIIHELSVNFDIYVMNADKLLLENVLNIIGNPFGKSIKSVQELSQIPKKSIVIIDDYHCAPLVESKEIYHYLKSVDSESFIIFINSNKEYLFYDNPHKEIFKDIVPVEIIHNNSNDKTDSYSETIFVYSKRKDKRNMVNKLTFEKNLKHSNEIIKVESMSEEQLKIKILEGILEATEKRLEHYIKLVSQLKKTPH